MNADTTEGILEQRCQSYDMSLLQMRDIPDRLYLCKIQPCFSECPLYEARRQRLAKIPVKAD